MTTKKVLLVEDNDDTRRMMRLIIELNGYEVVEAADGIEAIDVAESQHPDLIFMDVGLPRLDGVAAIRTIKSLNSCCNTPVCVVTAFKEAYASAFDAGCQEVIGKPVNFDAVERVLSQHLAGEIH
jgi:CheY-like chemotaxis protein